MIKTAELVSRLAQSPVVRSEIPMVMQLGFPYPEKRGEKLIVRFMAHEERYNTERIEFYSPKYELAWIYPFEHLVLFRDLSLESNPGGAAPIQTVSIVRMLSVGKLGIEELFRACDQILDEIEQNGKISDFILHRYQKQFFDLAAMLGLQMLYDKLKE